MWRKLLNWIRGYLCVRIKGSAPERFINLCCNKKIYIWNVTRVEDEYQFYISIKNYRKLKPIAKKTRLIPRIQKRVGLPFVLHRYKKRKVFFLGLIICSILVYIMSLFIWDIDLLGGSKYTPEAILKFLDDNQIYTGMKKTKVNCQDIERKIRLEYNDIGWVSAEVKGTRLIIKITETSMPAPAITATTPSHMVATKDAIILSIITQSGTPKVKVGDVVKKGDILVSGINEVKGDFDEILDYKQVVAVATISCKSYYDYENKFSLNYIKKEFSNSEKKGYYISFFNKKLFLYNPRNNYDKYDIIVNENTLHVTDSFYMPFRYGSITTREYTSEKRTYTEEEAISLANARIKRYFDRLKENGVIILENNITITIENNSCIAKGRIIVQEPAWEYRTIQDSEWRIEQTDEYN